MSNMDGASLGIFESLIAPRYIVPTDSTAMATAKTMIQLFNRAGEPSSSTWFTTGTETGSNQGPYARELFSVVGGWIVVDTAKQTQVPVFLPPGFPVKGAFAKLYAYNATALDQDGTSRSVTCADLWVTA